MTKFMQKSFSSGPASDAYRENYDRIFGKKSIVQKDTEPGEYPSVPDDLKDRIKQLHLDGDVAWEAGDKSKSSALHDEAFRLAEPYGLNPLPCKRCSCYMAARELVNHMKGHT